MAIRWTVQVLAAGHENRHTIETGVAGTDQEARGAATVALMAIARQRGRHEFWVTFGGSVMMVVPGLDDTGQVDIMGLWDALNLLPVAGTA